MRARASKSCIDASSMTPCDCLYGMVSAIRPCGTRVRSSALYRRHVRLLVYTIYGFTQAVPSLHEPIAQGLHPTSRYLTSVCSNSARIHVAAQQISTSIRSLHVSDKLKQYKLTKWVRYSNSHPCTLQQTPTHRIHCSLEDFTIHWFRAPPLKVPFP